MEMINTISHTLDDDLARALEQSAAEARERADRPLLLPRTGNNDGVCINRSVLLPPPLAHHFAARGGHVADGTVVSRGALDQFHAAFAPLISKYGCAGSICGYLTVANTRLLSSTLDTLALGPGAQLGEESVEALLDGVRDREAVFAEVERAMGTIQADRLEYIAAHPESFEGGAEGRDATEYVRAWVANFELADLLAGSPDEKVIFCRINQFPELSHASLEEAERIQSDEARFGGRAASGGRVTYAKGDSVFFFSRSAPSCGSYSPEEFMVGDAAPKLPCVVALDLNGHFTAALAYRDSASMPQILVVNSTETKYADKPQVAWLFDTLFPPAEGGGVACSPTPSPSSGVVELMGMGFGEAEVRAALEVANGNIARAVDALLLSSRT
eukprot:TRINITY_DN75730_c0_g1_i1.p1 TRINITY_DN75730_c0_g1~~TRINITY_DN75730_c0_g1_i1.p1  ORF type:complete len:387 (+),score=52.77 TRINITY_DN75730_c0_g1_i1:286-1446(+)